MSSVTWRIIGIVCGLLGVGSVYLGSTSHNAMLDLLASEKSQMKARLEKIITRETVPLDDFERGFEMVRSHQAVKLLLAPNGK